MPEELSDEELDKIIEDLYAELSNESTTAERLREIAIEHTTCRSCEVCKLLRENLDDIPCLVARHNNCDEETLTVLMEWSWKQGDNGWVVDVLNSASSRSNFTGRWFEYVLDENWNSKVQFEPLLVYEFISNLMRNRDLTDEEKNRIVIANDLPNFPSPDELKARGY